jgi:acyl carrier protein
MTASIPLAAELHEKLVHLLSREWRIPSDAIDSDKPFTEYGVDSITALTISGELEDSLDIELPMTLLWDCPTINALVSFVVEAVSNKRQNLSGRPAL